MNVSNVSQGLQKTRMLETKRLSTNCECQAFVRNCSPAVGARLGKPSKIQFVGTQSFPQNCVSHIDASLSRQPLVKGERLVRYEVNAVMLYCVVACCLYSIVSPSHDCSQAECTCCVLGRRSPKNGKDDLDDQT